jgi:FtsP/CotA-like multicopper oxidase with cupredoxin domain
LKQQQAGLTGALLVVNDPAKHDPKHDLVMLVTTPRKAADANTVLLNGTSRPAPLSMHVGEHYRLRFINVHVSRPSMRMRLLRGEDLVKWRSIAKDGMDLPSDQVRESASEVQMGNGETYDFDFVPTERGNLHLDITAANGTLLTSMPIHVVDATGSARLRDSRPSIANGPFMASTHAAPSSNDARLERPADSSRSCSINSAPQGGEGTEPGEPHA